MGMEKNEVIRIARQKYSVQIAIDKNKKLQNVGYLSCLVA